MPARREFIRSFYWAFFYKLSSSPLHFYLGYKNEPIMDHLLVPPTRMFWLISGVILSAVMWLWLQWRESE